MTDRDAMPLMTCGHCGTTAPWTPYGRCSWPCYDQERNSPRETRAAIEAAPEAFAFFLSLAPGVPVDDPADESR